MENGNASESRRNLLGLAAAGAGLGVLGFQSEARAQAAGLFASWVHGHNLVLERAVFTPGKAQVNAAFGRREWDGDLRDFGNSGAIAVSRLGWGARLVVFDYSSANNRKSGQVWCHYAVPTPVIVGGRRARLRQVLVRHTTPNPQQLAIIAVHVWDGDTRVFTRDGIVSPNPFVAPLPDREVLWGMGVSLLVNANNARNVMLDVHAVGIDFFV
jgi:hypothetical protein